MKRKLLFAMLCIVSVLGLRAQTTWSGNITNADGLSFTTKYADPSANDVAETWTSTSSTTHAFDVNQSLASVPDGVYELSAQAMYRASLDYGTATNCILYATVGETTYSTPIANFADYTAKEDRAQIGTQMQNNNAYLNVVPAVIVEGGNVTIGMKSVGELAYCTNGYWFVYKKSTFTFKDVTSTYHAKLVTRANTILSSAPASDAKTTLSHAVTTYADANLANVKALQAAINTFLETATVDNPLNVTDYITNPSFSDDSGNKKNWIQDLGYKQPTDIYQPTGWNMLYKSAGSDGKINNTQYQTYKTQTDGAKDNNCYYVRHRWGDVYAVVDLHQLVKELPAGAYRLTVAVKGGSNVTDANTLTMTAGNNTNSTTVSDFDKSNYKDYSVQVTKANDDEDLDISFGWNQKSGGEQLYYVDDFRLYYLGDPVKAKKAELNDLQATITDETYFNNPAYTNVVGVERTTLNTQKTATAAEETVDAYQTVIDNVQGAIDAFTAAKTNYDALVSEIAYAKTIGIETATADGYAATNESTAATALTSTQNLKTLEYSTVNTAYPKDVTPLLGTWGKGSYATTSGQGYTGDGTYFDKWNGSAMDLTSSSTVTLPSGKYVVKVAGRGQTGTTMNLSVKVGEGDAVSTPFFMNGDVGKGIDTAGDTNFSDEGTYSNNNNGRGWEYRYITFTTDGSAEVTVTVNGHLNAGTWQSFYAPVLLCDDATYAPIELETAKAELQNVIDGAPDAYVTNVGKSAFQYDEDGVATYSDALVDAQAAHDATDATLSSISNAKSALEAAITAYNALELIAPESTQAYNLVFNCEGHNYTGNALTLIPNPAQSQGLYGLKYQAPANVNLAQAFYFVHTTGNKYKIYAVDTEGNDRYITTQAEGYGTTWYDGIRTITDASKAMEIEIRPNGEGLYLLWNTGADKPMAHNGNDNNDLFTNYTANFQFVETTKPSITINTTAAGWGTTILPFAVADLPTGVKAYTCAKVSSSTLTLVEVDALEANKPYIIEGAWNETLTGDAQGTALTNTEGLLTGVYADTTAPDDCYVLAKISDKVGFYQVDNDDKPTVGANHAYLTAPAASVKAFFFDNETGINGVFDALQKGEIFDVNGRKVAKMQKGNIYIVGGRKVIVK